jgi:hypothetical protein
MTEITISLWIYCLFTLLGLIIILVYLYFIDEYFERDIEEYFRFYIQKSKSLFDFWKPKALKSPKEKYEDMLIERFKAGDYTNSYEWFCIQWDRLWHISWWIFYTEYKRLRQIVELHLARDADVYTKEFKKQEAEKKRIEEIQKQKEEDELYESKIKELLKIKPLDADLKEDFKKASRRIELSNNMLKRVEENKKDYAELLTIMPRWTKR